MFPHPKGDQRVRSTCATVITVLAVTLSVLSIGCGGSDSESAKKPAKERPIASFDMGESTAERQENQDNQASLETQTNRQTQASNEGGGLWKDIAPSPQVPRTNSAATIEDVRAIFSAGKTDEALTKAQAYLLSNPNDPEALFIAGQCLHKLDRVDEAIETLKLIPPTDSSFGLSSLGAIADWTVGLGKPQEAEAAFRRIVELHGDIPLAHSRIAMLLNSQGKRIESVPHLVKLASMQDITGRELGAMVTIADQCPVERVPGTTGTDEAPVEGDLRRARRMAMVQDWDESRVLTEKLRERFPESPSIAAFLGTLYMNLQQTDQLAKWAEKLPEGIDQQPEYWTTLARWLELQGRYEEAVRCCCESIARDPTNPEAYETFARVLKAVGMTEPADTAVQRSTLLEKVRDDYQETFVDDPVAADYIAIGEQLLELNRPWEALGWLKQASRMDENESTIAKLEAKLQAYEAMPNQAKWLLCDVDRSRFPLPESLVDSSATESADDSSTTETQEIALQDVAAKVGLDFQYDPGNGATDGSYLLYHTMGGGIGVLDYDRDGWADLYFSQGGGQAFQDDNSDNSLYRNIGGERFEDVSRSVEASDQFYGQGVTSTDLNQDGFPDLVVANIGPNTVYRNNGDGTFTRVELSEWRDRDHWTSAVACADLSGDGLIDLLECNYIDDPKSLTTRCTRSEQLCRPSAFRPAADRVLRGQNDGSYLPWPDAKKLEEDPAYTLGVIVTNLNDEPGNEIFLANDTVENALWFRSRDEESGRTRFTQESRLRGTATGPTGALLGCMGIATGDFDRNGTFDMYVTNYFNEASNLYLQQRAGLFVDSAALYKARDSSLKMVGFGTQAVDLQRDGWLDLVVLNGHAVDRRSKGEPFEMLPQVYRGGPGRLTTQEQDRPYWQTPALGRTLAVLDWNRDGRPDLVANHLDKPAALLQNESNVGNWLELDLVGTSSSRDAVGAKVEVVSGEDRWVSWVTAGDGYFCNNESVIDIGLGGVGTVDEIKITWPSGEIESFGAPSPNRRWLMIEGSGEAFEL